MDKLDKIWARPYVGVRDAGDWNGAEGVIEGSTYLLATPERELVSELVEALRIMTYLQSGGPYDALKAEEEVAKARAVLAKLEGKR